MDSFSGSWVANIAKSRRHENHQFPGAKIRFEVHGDAVSLITSGVNSMSGEEELRTLSLKADGVVRPVAPQAPDMTVVTRWIGSHALETVGKRGDKTIGRGLYEVSPDGRTMTAKVQGIDAKGKEFEQEIFFDRQP